MDCEFCKNTFKTLSSLNYHKISAKYCLKLRDSHLDDKRFHYRHELPNNLERIKKIGIKKWLREQKTKWQCPKCSGTIQFYHYKCSDCGFNNIDAKEVL